LWRIAELEYPRAASLGEARFLERFGREPEG
jgi:hypothetical protein